MNFSKIRIKSNIFIIAAISFLGAPLQASDHDDGVSSLKTPSLNLTDLYAFREDNQTGNPADKGNLILVMNTNPRSLPRQQYYFSTEGNYEFHISRVRADEKNNAPRGNDDVTIRLKFGQPDRVNWQPVTVSLIRSGNSTSQSTTTNGSLIRTTNLADAETPHVNQINLGGENVTLFAGLREDPFFFDVEQFFRVRAGALGLGPKVNFREPTQAVDFTTGYNVNSVVLRIPIALLQSNAREPIFDIWETVSVNGQQVERLARPAINEGLVVSNDFLNAFNSIPPSADLSPAAAPVLTEAAKSLDAFDMIDGKEDLTAANVVTAFIPDVMRLDTRVDIPLGTTAYNADLSGSNGILTGGRKIEDDVIDITLSFLVGKDPSGNSVKDNVSYAGVAGNAAQLGHRLLTGQSSRLGAAQFPFLAVPN
jgi:hypothetical protein